MSHDYLIQIASKFQMESFNVIKYSDQPGEVSITEKQECMTVIYIYSPL